MDRIQCWGSGKHSSPLVLRIKVNLILLIDGHWFDSIRQVVLLKEDEVRDVDGEKVLRGCLFLPNDGKYMVVGSDWKERNRSGDFELLQVYSEWYASGEH